MDSLVIISQWVCGVLQ